MYLTFNKSKDPFVEQYFVGTYKFIIEILQITYYKPF